MIFFSFLLSAATLPSSRRSQPPSNVSNNSNITPSATLPAPIVVTDDSTADVVIQIPGVPSQNSVTQTPGVPSQNSLTQTPDNTSTPVIPLIQTLNSMRCGLHQVSMNVLNNPLYRHLYIENYTGLNQSAVLPSLPTYHHQVYFTNVPDVRPNQNPIPDNSHSFGRRIFSWYHDNANNDDIGFFSNCPMKIFQTYHLTPTVGMNVLVDNTNQLFNVFTSDISSQIQEENSSLSLVELKNYSYAGGNPEKTTLGYLLSPLSIKNASGDEITRCPNQADLQSPQYSFLKNLTNKEVSSYQPIVEFTRFTPIKFIPTTQQNPTADSYFPFETMEVSLFLSENLSRQFIYKIANNTQVFADSLLGNEDYFINYPFSKKYKKIANSSPQKPENFETIISNGVEESFYPFTLMFYKWQYSLKKQSKSYILGCAPVFAP